MQVHYKPREIGLIKKLVLLTDRPVFIVGQCPGRQRKNDTVDYVFHGNRTGDFIEEIIDEIDSPQRIFLTNVTNYQIDIKTERHLKFYIEKGLAELIGHAEHFKPRRIIALGDFAYNKIIDLTSLSYFIPVRKLQHPSFILRFNKSRDMYKTNLKQLIYKP